MPGAFALGGSHVLLVRRATIAAVLGVLRYKLSTKTMVKIISIGVSTDGRKLIALISASSFVAALRVTTTDALATRPCAYAHFSASNAIPI